MKNLKLLGAILWIGIIFSCSNENSDSEVFTSNIQNDYRVSIEKVRGLADNFASEKNVKSLVGKRKDYAQKNSTDKSIEKFIKKAIKSIEPVKSEENENLFYVVNFENGGFLILSGDKRANPILAYSTENNFDLVKAAESNGLSIWFKGAKERLKKISKEINPEEKGAKERWEKLEKLGLSFKEIEPDPNDCEDEIFYKGPFINNTWHTGWNSTASHSYNYLFSVNNLCGTSQKAKAGCLPLAMAMIMDKWNYPSSYPWSTMPENATSSGTEQLLFDIYTALESDLSLSCASGLIVGADINIDLVDYFKNSFGFNSANKSDYTWNIVDSNIANNKPVIMLGEDANGNNDHSWVIDGSKWQYICIFDSNGNWVTTNGYVFFYNKWGYGGPGDGYYSDNNFALNAGGGTTIVYDTNLKVIHNITP